MQRRTFVGGILAGLAAPRPAKPKSGGIPKRRLGQTGEQLTIIGEGGARFHLISFTSIWSAATPMGMPKTSTAP